MAKPKKPVYEPAPQKYVVFRRTVYGLTEYLHPTQYGILTTHFAHKFTLIEAEAVARQLNARYIGPRSWFWWGVAEV